MGRKSEYMAIGLLVLPAQIDSLCKPCALTFCDGEDITVGVYTADVTRVGVEVTPEEKC